MTPGRPFSLSRSDPPVLRELVGRSHLEFSPTYAGGLTNHLPMCLVALARLGANDRELLTFFDEYSRRLDPAPAAAAQEADFSSPPISALLDGLAGAGFHGLIRLAYALELGDAGELSSATRYMQDTHAVLLPRGTNALPFATLLPEIRSAGLVAERARTLVARLVSVVEQPAFREIAGGLRDEPALVGEISKFGARLYRETSNFLALHVLTASHALRMIGESIGCTDGGPHALGIAALASYAVLGAPELGDEDVPEPASSLSASQIAERAIRSSDDHLAKLVFTCFAEDAHYGRPVYREIAERAALAGKA